MSAEERFAWAVVAEVEFDDAPAPAAPLLEDAPVLDDAGRFAWEPDDFTFGRQTRPLRHWEHYLSLDRLEEAIDGARARFESAGADAARASARAIAADVAAGKDPAARPPGDLVEALAEVLQDLYLTGRATVAEELARQAPSPPVAAFARPTARAAKARIKRRARVAARAVLAAIIRHVLQTDLQHDGATQATLQVAGEQAAVGALRTEGQLHAGAALNTGRSDEADAHASEIRGARYTSILDGNRCEQCEHADDDVLRSLDDPVRLARRPPNRDCYGGDRCRCIEFYELVDEGPASAARLRPNGPPPGGGGDPSLFDYREPEHPRWPKGHPQGGRWRPKGEHPGSIGKGGGITVAGLKHTDLIGMEVWSHNPKWQPGSSEQHMVAAVVTEAYGVDGYRAKSGDWILHDEPRVVAVIELPDGTAITQFTTAMRRRGAGKRDQRVRDRALGKDWKPPAVKPPPADKTSDEQIRALIDVVRTGRAAGGETLPTRKRELATVELGRAIISQVDQSNIARVEAEGEAKIASNKAEVDRLDVERRKLQVPYDERTPESAQRYRDLSDQMFALRQENVVIRRQVKGARGEALRQVLARHVELANPDASKTDARNHLQVGGGKSAKTVRAATRFVPADWVQASNSDPRPLKVKTSRGRAYFSERDVRKVKGTYETGRVISTYEGDESTALHEFAHNVEYLHPDIKALERAHRDRRVEQTADPTKQELRPLSAIYGGRGYKAGEKAYEDEFANAYTGKDYGTSYYEVLTMGAQLAFFGDGTKAERGQAGGRQPGGSASENLGPWADDPELVAFTVGVFAGVRRDLAGEKREQDEKDRQRAQWAKDHTAQVEEIDSVLADLDEAAYGSYSWKIKADALRDARDEALRRMSESILQNAVEIAGRHRDGLLDEAAERSRLKARQRDLEAKLKGIDDPDEEAAWKRNLDKAIANRDEYMLQQWEKSLDATLADKPRRERAEREQVEAYIGRYAAFPDWKSTADAMREVLDSGDMHRIRTLLYLLQAADSGQAATAELKDLLREWGYEV